MVVTCQQVWRELSNYLEGEVGAELRASMDEHFHSCSQCASLLAGTKNVIALYGDERMLEVPAGFSGRLQRRLVRGSRPSKPLLWWSAWLVPAAATLIVVAALMSGHFDIRHPVKSLLAPPVYDIPPDLKVVVSSGSRIFHVPGCSYIHDKNSERPLTAQEAVAQGYTPCSRCLRQYLKTERMHRGMVVAHRGQDQECDPHPEQDPDESEPAVIRGSIASSP